MTMSLPAVVPIKIAHGCYAAAYPDGDPAALMERALRGDGELSRWLRENGWSGDWTPLEREALAVEPPATHRQKKAKPSELLPSAPRRGSVPPPKQRHPRQVVALFDSSERRKLQQARVGGGAPSGPLGVPLGERFFLTLTLTITLILAVTLTLTLTLTSP